MKTLYIVVPCYNEQEVLFETNKRLLVKVNSMIDENKISDDSRICYVNDGSKDDTWQIIKKLNSECKYVTGVNLSRNKGHQNALLAGLMSVKDKCDITISMDADLQDDIEVISQFVDKYYEGNEIVYGVRSSRKKDTFFKKNSALLFYQFMKIMGVDIVFNHADYRLLSCRVVKQLDNYKEVNLFLRGIIPLIGFKSCNVEYERNERFAGESKYPLKKMLNFAFDGITSFTVKPIRFITVTGFLVFAVSILLMIYFLYVKFIGQTVTGWTTIAISIWAIGGLQLLSIGVVGEYVGKIYLESKHRPTYIVEEFLD